ncbi:UB-like protease 1A, partial [Striga asiatica]
GYQVRRWETKVHDFALTHAHGDLGSLRHGLHGSLGGMALFRANDAESTPNPSANIRMALGLEDMGQNTTHWTRCVSDKYVSDSECSEDYLSSEHSMSEDEIVSQSRSRVLDKHISDAPLKHIDVIFYYLRKMAFHHLPSIVESVTATDILFDQRMKNSYDKFLSHSDSCHVISPDNDSVDYMSGFKIIRGRHWMLVDHVLMPIHTMIDGVRHWILGRLSINERILCAYNSLRSPESDVDIKKALECYIVLLPSDCGIFMAAFAEHFMKGIEFPIILEVEYLRNRYSYLLYEHGCKELF